MDTKSKEYQEALNELCQAFLKFIKLSGAVVPSELAAQTFYQSLLNFINGNTGYSQPLTDSKEFVKESTVPEPSFSTTSVNNNPGAEIQMQDKIIKYAGNPVSRDGAFVFNRLTLNPSDQTKYKIEICNGEAEFEVYPITGTNMLDAYYAREDVYPKDVVSLSGKPMSERSALKSVSKGKGVAKGLIVKVLSACEAEYNDVD